MMDSKTEYSLWGGCFTESPSDVLRGLNDSLPMDQRLYAQDIEGSLQWARALHEAEVISAADYTAISDGLRKVQKEIEEEMQARGRLADCEEDIHSVVEKRLARHAGEAALRLHTGRSRNDQSATGLRLWLLQHLVSLNTTILELIKVLVDRAEKEIDVLMPGYTHLQRAQPVRWSHFLLSHAWALHEDVERMHESRGRVAQCPLGSGALAGCAFPVDRSALAARLRFRTATPNSMYAVASRDYIVEFLNNAALCGTHLSRLAEDLIIYATQEFGFIRLSDQFSTGSSLMPQKRNPDGLELVRGVAGQLMGESFGFHATVKALPCTYNKDLQFDKEAAFRSYDKLSASLKVMIGTIKTLEVNSSRMLESLDCSMLATDLAYTLVRRGVPFRTAHHHAGRALMRAKELNVELVDLSQHELQAISPAFPAREEIKDLWKWEASVEQYIVEGGTAKSSVQRQIINLRAFVENHLDKLS